VAAQSSLSERVLTGLLRTAQRVSSGHERANLLVDIASRHPLSGQARDLYIAAADSIGSSSDENRALAALVRADRR
jgi:hypothetical protein